MLRVYGSRISYYTGKLECYLRYRGLDYTLLPTEPHRREIRAGAGAVQMPVVLLPDGRWMSDSTPILDWLETRPHARSILPSDPLMRFVARLLEDYADEWLWRGAMHYRWSFRLDREHASGLLADELLGHLLLPRAGKRWLLTRRQYGGFVRGEGVTQETRAHVEQGVLRALDGLEAIFARRRFVLGDRPSLADFGFMGPMFRHLAMDPTPADLMRARAPGVHAWVARMWNARDDEETGPLPGERAGEATGVPPGERAGGATGVPPGERAGGAAESLPDEPLRALLREVCETHLVQLRENARAYASGVAHFEQTIQGVRYRRLPVSRYRVWCLERLREAWAALDPEAQARLRVVLTGSEAEVLWQPEAPAVSGYDPDGRAPFNRAINVFGRGVPR